MDRREFIIDALNDRTDCIAYEVSRKLQHAYPDRAVIDIAIFSIDLLAYARAEQCSVVQETCVYNKSRMEMDESGRELKEEPENAWFNVLWRGNLLEVLILTWTEDGYRTPHHWVIAETREVAEEFLAALCGWASEVTGEILVFDGGYWRKSQELFDAIKGASFENLILPPKFASEVRDDFARFFKSREVYERYHIPWKRGVLFIGPPGNGKTHSVKALINESKQPCLYVKSFKGWCGTDHDRIRNVFKQARKTTPCIVVLEDLDSLIDNHNRAFFLNELDGFAENTGVVVLATTNHPEKLDPAILDRPSRFDRKYYFELPAATERRAYFVRWSESIGSQLKLSNKGLRRAVEKTEGFSFAYLKELCLSSMMEWINDGGNSQMDKLVTRRAKLLRAQMTEKTDRKRRRAESRI